MSEGLTPERRAEFDAMVTPSANYDYKLKDVAIELLAEIDRLNKVVDQLLDVIETHYDDNFSIDATDSSIVWGIEWEDGDDFVWTDTEKPELAAELQRRGK